MIINIDIWDIELTQYSTMANKEELLRDSFRISFSVSDHA